ncbi:unnamed protein product, partial [Allacma fusca]
MLRKKDSTLKARLYPKAEASKNLANNSILLTDISKPASFGAAYQSFSISIFGGEAKLKVPIAHFVMS